MFGTGHPNVEVGQSQRYGWAGLGGLVQVPGLKPKNGPLADRRLLRGLKRTRERGVRLDSQASAEMATDLTQTIIWLKHAKSDQFVATVWKKHLTLKPYPSLTLFVPPTKPTARRSTFRADTTGPQSHLGGVHLELQELHHPRTAQLSKHPQEDMGATSAG